MNKEYILSAENEYVPMINIRELHLFNGADGTTGDNFTDDGYFHLWGIVYDKPTAQFSPKVKTQWGDVNVLKEYTRLNYPEAKCVKLGTISVKPNNKLNYDQYWEYLWNGAFEKADGIVEKIKIGRNEFSNKVFEF